LPEVFRYLLPQSEEQQASEDEFAALDVRVAHKGHNAIQESCEDKAEEAESGFGMGNE
jgi:hypothetical protein